MLIIQNSVSETNYQNHILDFVQCLPEHCSYKPVFSKYLSTSMNINCILLWVLCINFICYNVHKKQTPWSNWILKSVQILGNIFSSGRSNSTCKRQHSLLLSWIIQMTKVPWYLKSESTEHCGIKRKCLFISIFFHKSVIPSIPSIA